jgi:hypothetical protein
VGSGRRSGGERPDSTDAPLTSEVIDAIADAMSACELAEEALAWAAGQPTPADPHGVAEHVAKTRIRIKVLRDTAQQLADGKTSEQVLAVAGLLLLQELEPLRHCVVVGPWREPPPPRPNLKRACDVKRNVDKLLPVAQAREEGGTA